MQFRYISPTAPLVENRGSSHPLVGAVQQAFAEWWVRRVRPILDEFVMAARGRPLEPVEVEHVGGWVADLFPYLGDSKKYRNEGHRVKPVKSRSRRVT